MTWEDIPGWFDWEVFYRNVIANYPGGTLVEVGCYLGRSLCFLESVVRESGKPFRVVGVDHCLGSGIENGVNNHLEAVQNGKGSFVGQLYNNIRACGYEDTITLIVTDSISAASLFPNESLAMVFLDASHNYESVKRDISAWRYKIIKGGIIAGDDMGLPGQSDNERVWPDIHRAVDELLVGWKYEPHDAWSCKLGE